MGPLPQITNRVQSSGHELTLSATSECQATLALRSQGRHISLGHIAHQAAVHHAPRQCLLSSAGAWIKREADQSLVVKFPAGPGAHPTIVGSFLTRVCDGSHTASSRFQIRRIPEKSRAGTRTQRESLGYRCGFLSIIPIKRRPRRSMGGGTHLTSGFFNANFNDLRSERRRTYLARIASVLNI